jgi:ABC-type branched-subunit amino acid transport system ATPase component
MTLLQRGVIERLREAGLSALADMARHEWMQDKAIQGREHRGRRAARSAARGLGHCQQARRSRNALSIDEKLLGTQCLHWIDTQRTSDRDR